MFTRSSEKPETGVVASTTAQAYSPEAPGAKVELSLSLLIPKAVAWPAPVEEMSQRCSPGEAMDTVFRRAKASYTVCVAVVVTPRVVLLLVVNDSSNVQAVVLVVAVMGVPSEAVELVHRDVDTVAVNVSSSQSEL